MCVCTHGRDKYNYHRYNTHTRTPNNLLLLEYKDPKTIKYE